MKEERVIPLRKLLLCLLSVLILASLTAPVFAGTVTTLPQSESSTVKISVSSAKSVTYKIDIAWEDMNFTYDFGTLVWDVNTHSYQAPNPVGWNKKTSHIILTNHSNVAVYATPSLTDVTSVPGVNATLNKTEKFQLDSAEDGSAKSGTVTLTIDGTPESNLSQSNISFKTVTIRISAS